MNKVKSSFICLQNDLWISSFCQSAIPACLFRFAHNDFSFSSSLKLGSLELWKLRLTNMNLTLHILVCSSAILAHKKQKREEQTPVWNLRNEKNQGCALGSIISCWAFAVVGRDTLMCYGMFYAWRDGRKSWRRVSDTIDETWIDILSSHLLT